MFFRLSLLCKRMDNFRKVVCSIIKSFLGPNKSSKFLTRDKNVCVSRCPVYIFENTFLQDSISCLVEDTLFAHHESYGCSTLTLLAMWYFWSEEIRLALEEGCEMGCIVEHSQNILEEVISALPQITVNIDEMLVLKKPQSIKIAGFGVIKNKNDSHEMPISIRYSSRHLSPSLQNCVDKDGQNSDCLVNESCLMTVIKSLDHGEDDNISDLVLECWKKQVSFTKCAKFKKENLLVCPIVLPRNNSSVVDGLVIKCNFNHSLYQDRTNANSNRALIILGSITHEYTHLGFAPKVSISYSSYVPLIIKKDQWRMKCCDLIKKLKINALFVKDEVDSEIINFCLSNGVFVFHRIPLEAFKKICTALKYSPCTYIWDCNEENVIQNFIFKEWKPKDHVNDTDKYFLFNTCESSILLQTFVICHPSLPVLKMYQHQMQHLMSRLSLAFDSQQLLPGASRVEKWCCEFLECQKTSENIKRIKAALINGFKNYSVIIEEKKKLSHNKSEIMDEMSSKVGAWRSALLLVLFTIQCNMAIINEASDITMDCINLIKNTL